MTSFQTVRAGGLEEMTIRPERMAENQSPLPILVTVKTGNNQSEDGLMLKIGDGWTVTASSLAISTAGLPAGVTAWPGSNLNGVFGNNLYFSSNDLNNQTTYGFYITGGIGTNPVSGDGAAYKWQAATLNNGSQLEMSEVKLAVIKNDEVTVTGKVGAKENDFQLKIESDKNYDLEDGEEIEYTITYGSYLLNSTKPLVVSAEWSLGTIEGSPVPTVEVVDYVIGSGSTAWGGVEPVIDPINRKISWTINSFPAELSDQLLSFKLKTGSSYMGNNKVSFVVKATLNGANIITLGDEVVNTYQPKKIITPIPEKTTVQPTEAKVMPTQLPLSQKINIEKIEIVGLSTESVEIEVKTNIKPESLKISYGTSLKKMDKTLIAAVTAKINRIKIDNLKAGTVYFFTIEATGEEGETVVSENYTFQTAKTESQLKVDKKSILIGVENNVLLDSKTNEDSENKIILTRDQDYVLRINLNNPEKIKQVKVMVRNSQVLGISSVYGFEPNWTEVSLIQVDGLGFVGHLKSPETVGYYEILIRIEDMDGNITEESIANLRVISPLKVTDEMGLPIENAKVEFYMYNNDKKMFVLISPETFGIQNPVFTQSNGEVKAIFPKGTYRVVVNEIGYSNEQQDFTIGFGENEKIPTVILRKERTAIGQRLKYLGKIAGDVYFFSKQFIDDLMTSRRFLKLVNLLTGCELAVLMWWWGVRKTKVYWWLLPKKIFSILRKKINPKQKFLQGTVLDTDFQKPIGNAKVYLVDDGLNKIIGKGMTNDLGEFLLKIKPAKSYKLTAVKEGYEPTPMYDFTPEGIMAGDINLEMDKTYTPEEKTKKSLLKIMLLFSQWIFTLLIMAVMVTELIFWHNFGWKTNGIGVIFSWVSMAIWLKMILKNNDE